MSHYTVVKSRMTNKSALARALVRMGFDERAISVHEQSTEMHGYGSQRRQAHVVVKKNSKNASRWGDLGWEIQEDGTMQMHVDDMDLRTYDKNWQDKLFQSYSREVILESAENQGFFLEEETETNGEIFITLSTPY